ncbi:multidrug transporter [Pontibacter aydingkolensis]|uniref:Multidrug transporter n=1 Tax=Pontibacter aydingkolensis TaxID=1911536 RepID=A0ABS7CUL6_9BACT|nr:multidrug transporter [Pontibacter aydingkolensis]
MSATGVAKRLLLVVGLLFCLHSTGVVLESILEYESRVTRIIVRYFDLNGEENVPAFFSSVILLAAACLLLLIYRTSKYTGRHKGNGYWLALAVIFVFMAVDESVQIHEHIAEFVRPQLTSDLNGLLHWAWVVPYTLVVAGVVAVFFRWVLLLPATTRNLFFLSGGMFVLGALGFEFIEGYLFKHYGLDHIYNRIMYTLEELLEMTAVILFIYALLQYLAKLKLSVSLIEGKDASG